MNFIFACNTVLLVLIRHILTVRVCLQDVELRVVCFSAQGCVTNSAVYSDNLQHLKLECDLTFLRDVVLRCGFMAPEQTNDPVLVIMLVNTETTDLLTPGSSLLSSSPFLLMLYVLVCSPSM